MNDYLQDTLDFTAEDLQANRDGYMTKRQRRRIHNLRKESRRARKALWIVLIGLVVSAFWFSEGILTLPIVILIMILAIDVFISSLSISRMNQDLYKGLIDDVEGKLRLIGREQGQGHKNNYTIKIAQKKFSIPLDAYLRLRNGGIYCIYFAPNTHTLLSIEAIDTISHLTEEDGNNDDVEYTLEHLIEERPFEQKFDSQ
jgi:Flp pilus assembly protein TadB